MLDNFRSVPPSRANRAALAFAISASNPRWIKAVFSLMPVNAAALDKMSSLIIKVVLMHMHMAILYAFVKDPQVGGWFPRVPAGLLSSLA